MSRVESEREREEGIVRCDERREREKNRETEGIKGKQTCDGERQR